MKCLECQSVVSSSADNCPNCGNTRFAEQWRAEELKLKAYTKERDEELLKKAKSKGFASYGDMSRAEEKKEKNQKNTVIIILISIMLFSIVTHLFFPELWE